MTGGTHMKWISAAACVAAISLAFAPAADAKGCIKGATVGGVAGHMVGHGKLGAAAGCVVGHHEANKKNPNNANAQQQAPSGQK
jgi:outer membrane lipoprotein SlyB